MIFLITRPLADAADLSAALKSRGHSTITSPLFDVVLHDGPTLDTDRFQGVLATSANGIRALANRTNQRDCAIYAVGDATAHEAKTLGFASVQSASGDVHSLAALIDHLNLPKDRPFLHVAGTTVAGDLAGHLGTLGYDVERAVLYEVKAVKRLTEATEAALKQGDIFGIFVYSPRTGTLLIEALNRADIAKCSETITLFVLSDAVAVACGSLRWRAVRVAPHPTTEDLLALIDSGV